MKHLVIANSSLPAVQQAVRNRRVGEDSRADRMTIWLQNVESKSAIRHVLANPLMTRYRGRRRCEAKFRFFERQLTSSTSCCSWTPDPPVIS